MGSWASTLKNLIIKDDEETPLPPRMPIVEDEPEEEASASVEAAPVPVYSGPVVENRPFEDIYGAARVPPSPYSVEKLLKVIDGLGAMPTETRRTVIAAMDAADESWTLDDPVRDATVKIEALKGAKAGLTAAVDASDAQTKLDQEALDAHVGAVSLSIKEQIEALQKKLHDEIQAANTRRAELDAAARATKEAAFRETMRLDTEIARLNVIPTSYGAGKK